MSNFFGQTIPDIDIDPFAEQLPRSTYAPPPVDVAVLDYDEMMAEILRLEVLIQEAKARVNRITSIAAILLLFFFCAPATAQTVEIARPAPSATPTPSALPQSQFENRNSKIR